MNGYISHSGTRGEMPVLTERMGMNTATRIPNGFCPILEFSSM
jgi:hypothetical protein